MHLLFDAYLGVLLCVHAPTVDDLQQAQQLLPVRP
jgi:hypothetical protein